MEGRPPTVTLDPQIFWTQGLGHAEPEDDREAGWLGRVSGGTDRVARGREPDRDDLPQAFSTHDVLSALWPSVPAGP